MSNEEYVEIMDNSNFMIDSANPYDMQIKEALEKQIPKVPYYNGKIAIDTWECPYCGEQYEVDYEDYKYCPNCGQHIDHSTLT